MQLNLRFASLVACAAALTFTTTAGLACGSGAHACCAAGKAAAVAQPAPMTPAPAMLAGFPVLIPALDAQPLVSGLRAYIDPETGRLTGTTGLEAPTDLFAPMVDVANLPQIRLADGSFMIDTSGMLDSYVVQVDVLGHRQFQCTRDARQALAPAILPTPTVYVER